MMWCWKKKVATIILVMAILAVVMPQSLIMSAVASGSDVPTAISDSPEPYKVGALFAATGSNAALGNPQKQTVEMMVEQINATGGIGGHPLEVITYDYESDAAKCSTLANKLIYDDNVTAIIGPTGTGDTNAILDMAKDAEIPLISCAAGAGIVTPYAAPATGNDRHWIFSTPQVSVMLVQRLYEYLNTENISRIAILTDAVGFGADGRNHLNGQAATYGITITSDQTYGANDADMIAQLTLINGTNPQAVVCWGRTPGSAIVAKNMTTLDMRDIPLFCSHSITLESFTTLAGDSANGVMFASGKLPVADYLVDSDPQKALLLKYRTDFNAKYGDGTANTFGGHAYDALSIVVEALKNAVQQDPGTINGSHDVLQAVRAEIRDYIESSINSSGYPGTGGYPGTAGIFNMSPDNHNGLSKDSLVMVKIVNGDWTPLETPSDISGTWSLRMTPEGGTEGEPWGFYVHQEGTDLWYLDWQHDFSIFVNGSITGDNLELSGSSTYYGATVSFLASGIAQDSSMSGTYAYSGGYVESGTWTAERCTCKQAKAWVRTATIYQSVGSDPEYALDFAAWDLISDNVAFTAVTATGPGITLLDLASSGPTDSYPWTSFGAYWTATEPAAGDTYEFSISYSDGSSEIVTATVRDTFVGTPGSTSPSDGEIINTRMPTFTWDPPSCQCQGYYRIWVIDSQGNDMWSVYLPAEATSVVYNYDGYGAPLGEGQTYEWRLIAFDAPILGGPDNDVLVIRTFTVGSQLDESPPSTPVVTDDGNFTTNTSQLHVTWSSSDPESGITEYQYAIGTSAGGTDVVGWTSTGTNTEVTQTGLSLNWGTTYYFAVKAKNGSGLWSEVGVSNGITVSDFTAPTTPTVTDGGATTSSTSQLYASWTSSDAESGVAEYQYAIGTTSGGTDISGWTSVGSNSEVTKTGLSLTVGTIYYFAVRAKNGVGLWSGVGVSDGIAVVAPADTTPPTTPVVSDDGATTTSTSQLHATWSSTDAESGIAEYQYTIGTTAGGTDVVSWTSVGMNTEVARTGLSLSWGTAYFFSVKAKNGSGDWSSMGSSDGVTVTDATSPATPVVTDDGATTSDGTKLHATWSASDPESGIAEYQYAIGTTSGGTDVVGWTSTGTTDGVTKTGLTLTAGTKYFISVKAKNGAGLWSEVGISNGITVAAEGMAVGDLPPAGGTVQTADGKITAEFPANATVGALTVTIEYIEPPSDKSAPQGLKAGNTYFVIEVRDAGGNAIVTLSQPVTITVKYTDEDVEAAGGNPSKLVLAYYDEAVGEWQTLDTTVNTIDKTLSANTTHLSTWAVLAKAADSNGAPIWIWIIVGLGAVAVIAGGIILSRRMAKKPAAAG
jgi:branched-chain amino acid transport system substrate-binding protein